MTTTSDEPELKSRAITARVTDTFYEAFAAKAAEVPGRTPAELARQVLERYVYEDPSSVKLLEELWALRYIVINALPHIASNQAAAAEEIHKLIAEAEYKKAAKAQTILKGTR